MYYRLAGKVGIHFENAFEDKYGAQMMDVLAEAISEKEFSLCTSTLSVYTIEKIETEGYLSDGDNYYDSKTFIDPKLGVVIRKEAENAFSIGANQDCPEWFMCMLEIVLLKSGITFAHCAALEKDGQALFLPAAGATATDAASPTDLLPALPPETEDSVKRSFRWFGVDLMDNYRMSAVYFEALIGPGGGIRAVDTDRLPEGREEEAKQLAASVIVKSEKKGRSGDYRFQSVEAPFGRVYVFLDISYQRYAVIRVAYTSLLVGILCIEIMYFFVRILARKAIRPIAQNMERQKQFITDAGHELKTPVAIIMANTEAMELCTGETKWSRNIREQAQRLSGLTQNLLTLAKIDENTFMESVEQVSLTKTVNSVIDMFIEPAALKHIMIESDVGEAVELKANQDMMTRLISTLLDNAVKYASSDSTVRITLLADDDGAEFVIKNRCDELPNCEP